MVWQSDRDPTEALAIPGSLLLGVLEDGIKDARANTRQHDDGVCNDGPVAAHRDPMEHVHGHNGREDGGL